MSRETRIPSLPEVSSIKDPQLRRVLAAVKEALDVRLGRRGDPLDRAATVRELYEGGIVTVNGRSGPRAGSTLALAGAEPVVYALPVGVSGLTATGALTHVLLQWALPTYTGHSHIEVWRSDANDLGTAEFIGTSGSAMYSDPVEQETVFYYWVRAVNVGGVPGPFNATAGTSAAAAISPAFMLSSINSVLSDPQSGALFQTVADNFAVVDSGTGKLILGTFNGVAIIDGAFITNLTVKNEQVENLSVDKLIGDTGAFVEANIGDATIGTAKLADLLQSTNYSPTTGWAIYKSGAMVLNDVYARGDIEATTIKAGSVNIVDTLMLQGQSVSFTTSTQANSEVPLSTVDTNAIVHVFVLGETTKVHLTYVGQVMVDDNSSSRVGRVQGTMYVKESGVTVATLYPYIYVTSTTLADSYATVVLVGSVTLPAGTYSAFVDMKRVDGAPSASAAYNNLTALALKR